MFVVESDIIPPPDALESLAAADADVAYGVYLFRRGFPYQANVLRPDGKPLSLFIGEWGQAWGHIVACNGGGLGCVLIRRHVLEETPFRDHAAHCDTAFTEDVQRYVTRAHMGVVCGHKRPDGLILWPTQTGEPDVTLAEATWIERDPTEEYEEALHGGPLRRIDMVQKGIYALYIGEGRTVPGVPAKHLTREEWEEYVVEGLKKTGRRYKGFVKLCEELYSIQKPVKKESEDKK